MTRTRSRLLEKVRLGDEQLELDAVAVERRTRVEGDVRLAGIAVAEGHEARFRHPLGQRLVAADGGGQGVKAGVNCL
jgi:hypothetical protein